MSASTVSKPIFEIKATEERNKISTRMLSGSGKKRPIFWLSGCKRLEKNLQWWFWLVTGNIPLSSKVKTVKNNVIEYMEYNVYELTNSDFSKDAAREFDQIDHGEDIVFPL